MEAALTAEDVGIFGGRARVLNATSEYKNAEFLVVEIASEGLEMWLLQAPVWIWMPADFDQRNLGQSFQQNFWKKLCTTASRATCRFGNSFIHSFVTRCIKLLVASAFFIDLYLELVEADVPLSLTLDDSTQLKAYQNIGLYPQFTKRDRRTRSLTNKNWVILIIFGRHYICLWRWNWEKHTAIFTTQGKKN